jgi:hypothetical protein
MAAGNLIKTFFLFLFTKSTGCPIPLPMQPGTRFNLSTLAAANGRINGMSCRSPLNRTVDLALSTGNADLLSSLRLALAEKIQATEEKKNAALKKFSRTNARSAANAFRQADIALAALLSASRRLS